MWKQVNGYEDLYEVSDNGEVRRIGGNILKPQKGTHGYTQVSLSKGGKVKNAKVHRLVAIAFISNPKHLVDVNHIDGNKRNNCVSNLEWVTQSQNNQHAWDNGLNRNTAAQRAKASFLGRKAIKIAQERHKRAVLCLNTGEVFSSIKDAEQALGVDHSKISAVASGKRNQTGGYRFAYAEEVQ